MVHLKIYNIIRILSTISFVAVVYEYWGTGFIGNIFMLTPYLLVFMLANKSAYKTRLRVYCRATAGVLVPILTIGLLFGVESDAQAAIGIGFGIVMQYGVIFVSEAIIGLMTYEESST